MNQTRGNGRGEAGAGPRPTSRTIGTREFHEARREERPMRTDAEREGDRERSLRGPRTGARRWRPGNICVRDVMTSNPKSVRQADTVQRIAELMVQEDCGIVPVVEDDRLMGVVTDRDIVCRLVARGLDMKAATARDVMTDDVECVTERDTLRDVLRLMSEHQVRRVPVVARGDRLVGIVSMADIAREADVDEDLQDTFEEISSERSFWSRLR
jgi:CBS domain-containing protein